MKRRWREAAAARARREAFGPPGPTTAPKCEACGEACSMRIRGPVALRVVALHRCMHCAGFQEFTVRKPDGSLHRVTGALPSSVS